MQADATDEAALRQLGVADVRHAVVAIGDGTQSSILATATLADMGIPDIWAKAQTVLHARILERVGAHHVVFPERDMGQRVAHRVTGQMLEFIQIDESFALVETRVPVRPRGRTLLDVRHPRRADGVTVVAVKSGRRTVHPPLPPTPAPGSARPPAGCRRRRRNVERFAALDDRSEPPVPDQRATDQTDATINDTVTDPP